MKSMRGWWMLCGFALVSSFVGGFQGDAAGADDGGRAGPGDPAQALSRRPQPNDLDFFKIKAALSDHVHRLPPEQQASEKERIRELSNIREYLVKLFKFIPYNSTAGVRLANGRTVKGSLWGNEQELVLRPPNGRGKSKSLKWADIAVDQFPLMLEFYAQQRLQHGPAAKEKGENSRKEAAYDYFRAALLADWYGKPKLAVKYAKLAVAADPALEVRVETLLPGLLREKQAEEANTP
jgi:hypothetical protein